MRRAWQGLTRMRTAIILLFFLAAGSAVGSLFPQRAISARSVSQWQSKNPGWTPVAEFFDLFDVYGSWWFTPIYLLLLVSLIGCLTSRYRVQLRRLRRDPHATGDLERQERYVRARTTRSPSEVLESARSVLLRRRFKVVDIDDGVAAERGHLRESGSLLFHTSILVILLGVALGRLFGASGQVLVVEGATFTDTPTEYDTISPGRFFGSRHTGFQLRLEEFDVEWFPSGIPKHFESTVTLRDADGQVIVEDEKITVNYPLRYEGRRIYQIAWGWAPVIKVEQEGRVLYDGPTVFLPNNGAWTGVAKVPGTQPQQLGLAMQLFVDPFEGPEGGLRDRNRAPRDPVIVSQVLLGDLGLDKPQNVYALDPAGLTRVGDSIVGIGRSDELTNGITITFSDMVQYSVFQIGYNPGAWMLFAGAVAMLVGLIPGLYGFRRRVWLRATTDGYMTVLEIAGHAFQRKQAASEEFDGLVEEIDRVIGHERALGGVKVP
ncbi:MAG: cytochrome c biogenesis protein ResB [Actinomycetota bacterium]